MGADVVIAWIFVGLCVATVLAAGAMFADEYRQQKKFREMMNKFREGM